MNILSKPLVLTIGGFDPSSGAGITADLKVFNELGVYGLSAASAITAQNSAAVFDVFTPPADSFKMQLEVLFKDMLPGVIKVGALSTKDNISVIKEPLLSLEKKELVLDPVFRATSGMQLLSTEGQQALIDDLLPISLIITPNVDEAEIISGIKIESLEAAEKAASIINDLGPKWVVIKGGHHRFDKETVQDLIFDGVNTTILKNEWLDKNVRGTGCLFSAAIAAFLAKGYDELEAIKEARQFVQMKIKEATQIGKGRAQI